MFLVFCGSGLLSLELLSAVRALLDVDLSTLRVDWTNISEVIMNQNCG